MTAGKKLAQKRLTLHQLAEKLRNVCRRPVGDEGCQEAGFMSTNGPFRKEDSKG